MNPELFEVAAKNLRKQGVRTYLTLIGIVIGIGAIVALLSVGQGLNVAIESQFEQLGSNTIFVIPGADTGGLTELSDSDIKKLESFRGVETVVPIYSSTAVFEFGNSRINVNVSAAEADRAAIFDDTGFFDIKEGRMISNNDSSGVLLGEIIAEDLFSKEITLRNRVQINGKSFKVVGILNEQAQTVGGGGPSTGSTVFMSKDGFDKIFDSSSPGIIFVQTFSQEDVEYVVESINDYFEKKYGEKSVFVSSSEQLLEQVGSILGIVTIFLAGIAGISLFVGGIGITNAMIASVLERTKEIGLLKSLGASSNDVLVLFLIEAAFIGAIGGLIGIVLGFGIASLIAFVGEQLGFALVAVFDPLLALGALAFAMFVGMASGFYPASRAAKLDPITALRYE
jgi:putative ABC transport system permease protein